MLFLMQEQKQQGGFAGDKIYSQQLRFTKEKQSVHSGTVGFMCADGDAVQAAVVFCAHVVLALGNGTVNVVIFLHFHGENPHFYKDCSTGERE